jgi:hypothetical protein
MKSFNLLLLLISLPAFSQMLHGDIDSIPYHAIELPLEKGTDFFRADDIIIEQLRSNQVSLQLFIKKNNSLTPINIMEFNLKSARTITQIHSDGRLTKIDKCELTPNSKFKVSFELKNQYFQIAGKKTYELLFNLNCGEKTELIFDYDSIGGQVMAITDIATIAKNKLEKDKLLNFWKKRILFKWPARGDYYSYNIVNVTKGYRWDVVGHELGHAIYDQANIGTFGGGQHFIDQCYSKALALSEGWASLFSAWIKVSLNDPDAKFEYMVKRRAPLKFETIPSDVCASQKNEWRVTGFLWDLIDFNVDLVDQSDMNFIKFWKYSENKKFKSTKQLAQSFLNQGFDPILMNIIWKQNFLTDL